MKLLVEKGRICLVSALCMLVLGTISCSQEETAEELPPQETPEPTPKPPRSGETIYKIYCTPCHLANGTGHNGQWAADFVNDKERMAKSDEELLNSIREGFQGEIGIMPRWKNRLSEEEMVAVLQYIRETFSDPKK